MAELGETRDPVALIPGKPEAIEENARVLQARAAEAGDAADGLKAIDTGARQGPAASAFHDKFSYEPGKWYAAADSLQAASGALNDHASTLRWAQAQAAEAISLWNQGQAATQQAKASHDLRFPRSAGERIIWFRRGRVDGSWPRTRRASASPASSVSAGCCTTHRYRRTGRSRRLPLSANWFDRPTRS